MWLWASFRDPYPVKHLLWSFFGPFRTFYSSTISTNISITNVWQGAKWNKNGPSKICGKQPLKNFLGPFLNTLAQICLCFALTHLNEYFVEKRLFGFVAYIFFSYFWRKYCSWSINCPGHLFQIKSFWVDISSDWALNQAWALIKKKVKTAKGIRQVKFS